MRPSSVRYHSIHHHSIRPISLTIVSAAITAVAIGIDIAVVQRYLRAALTLPEFKGPAATFPEAFPAGPAAIFPEAFPARPGAAILPPGPHRPETRWATARETRQATAHGRPGRPPPNPVGHRPVDRRPSAEPAIGHRPSGEAPVVPGRMRPTPRPSMREDRRRSISDVSSLAPFWLIQLECLSGRRVGR